MRPSSETGRPTVEARQEVRIPNKNGLHARPCHLLVRTALRFQSEVSVACSGRKANGRSILELMTLNAPQGSLLELTARGEDAQALVRALGEVIAGGFEEGN